MAGRPVLRHREQRRKSIAVSMPCRRWRCVVCCRRNAFQQGGHYGLKLLGGDGPVSVASATSKSWPALKRLIQRAKGSYVRAEWPREPGTFIVWTTAAEVPDAQVLDREEAVRLLGHTLRVVCESVMADAAARQTLRLRAEGGKRARLLCSSRDWALPKKPEKAGDWERVGAVRTDTPDPVVELLRKRGISPTAVSDRAADDGGTLRAAEWSVAWFYPESWTPLQVEELLLDLRDLAGGGDAFAT
jgi:hypothetical protein